MERQPAEPRLNLKLLVKLLPESLMAVSSNFLRANVKTRGP
eukprot:CAMPEP_0195568590 /NCGR_PEP_ID=MMETSP0814-20130614/2329_1 /TAXON_ID=97485 /ORGANISM="Prymnesium parvum, Strain Texoma1" /LENGTH=40 /DNA_ID= /DNA_START= /DNA_END= /DNA_ORIENTATION=